MSRAIAIKEENLPAIPMEDMAADAGSGFENITTKDTAVPFLTVLQAMSPQVKRGDQQVPGAAEGDIFNTVTKEIFKAGVRVIPCAFQKRYVEWKDRDSGGGLVAQHETELPSEKDEKGKLRLSNGNLLVPTAYHYVLVVKEDGSFYPAIMGLSSTQLKKSRQWVSSMQGLKIKTPSGMATPAMFSHSYLATTVTLKNGQGQTWMGWEFSAPEMLTDSTLYSLAKAFSKEVLAGGVKAAEPVKEDPITAESEHF